MATPFGTPHRRPASEARLWVRVLWLPVLCVVFMVVALTRAGDANRRADAAARVDNVAATTAVLSARRLPSVLALPGQIEALAAPTLAALDGVPPDTTCVSIVNERGFTVFEHNGGMLLTPASNQKVLLAYALFRQLGADHAFVTTLNAAVTPVNGVVSGDLWLVGSGDPVLATRAYVDSFEDPAQRVYTPFEALADQLVAAGVTRVTGNVLADASRFDGELYHPNWPSRFAADGVVGPISALSVNNGFDDFSPAGQLLAGSGAPSPDPAGSAAQLLIALLTERGVAVEGIAGSGAVPAGPAVLARVQSPPLRDIAGQMLRTSDNTVAETLFKELGVARLGTGSFAAAADAMRSVLGEHGLTGPGMVISDGSGLDTADRVSCDLLAAALREAGRDSELAAGLAVAGRSGTVRSRLADTAAAGQARVKTGTLASTTSLAGFVDTAKGESVTFAIIVNAPDAAPYKDIEDRLVVSLLAYPSGPDVAALGPQP